MSGCNKLDEGDAKRAINYLENFMKFFVYYVNMDHVKLREYEVYYNGTSKDSDSIKYLWTEYEKFKRLGNSLKLPSARRFQHNIDRWHSLENGGIYRRPVNPTAQAREEALVGLFLNHVVSMWFLSEFQEGGFFGKIKAWSARNIPPKHKRVFDSDDFTFEFIESRILTNIRVESPSPWIFETPYTGQGATFTEVLYSLHDCLLERLKQIHEGGGQNQEGAEGAAGVDGPGTRNPEDAAGVDGSGMGNPYIVDIL